MSIEKLETKSLEAGNNFEEVFGRGKFTFEIGGDTSLRVAIRRDRETPNEVIVEELDLQNKAGQIKSLFDFLPKGWRIVLFNIPQINASTNFLDKIIELPRLNMRGSSRDIPDGEVLEEPKLEKKETLFGKTYYNRRVTNIRKLRKVDILECLPIFQDNPDVILSFLHEAGHANHPNNKDLPEDYEKRAGQLYLRRKDKSGEVSEERDVWAFAIKAIRGLKREGFNFGGAFNKREIDRNIRYPLLSYHDPKTLKKVEHEKSNG
jgi:hypothetical protein